MADTGDSSSSPRVGGDRVIVVVSPHLDDALLSIGAWLSWHTDVVVVTMFAGDPDDDIPITAWDSACGFSSGRHAMGVRRHEDKRAAAVLGATIQHVPLADGQYREEIPYEEVVLDATVATIVGELAPSLVLAPLGLVHSDHLAVAAACRRVLRTYRGDVVLYEELPYRVDNPPAAVHTLDRLDVLPYSPETCPDDELAVRLKIRAVGHYTSQLWAVPRWSLYVPERMWEWVRVESDELELDVEEEAT